MKFPLKVSNTSRDEGRISQGELYGTKIAVSLNIEDQTKGLKKEYGRQLKVIPCNL
jgi:hypothetical protein